MSFVTPVSDLKVKTAQPSNFTSDAVRIFFGRSHAPPEGQNPQLTNWTNAPKQAAREVKQPRSDESLARSVGDPWKYWIVPHSVPENRQQLLTVSCRKTQKQGNAKSVIFTRS